MIPIWIPKTLQILHSCLEHQSSRNLTYHISYTNLSSSCLSASIIGQISTCMFRIETSQSFLTSPSCLHPIFVDYSFKIYLWFIQFPLLISTTTNTNGNHSFPLHFPYNAYPPPTSSQNDCTVSQTHIWMSFLFSNISHEFQSLLGNCQISRPLDFFFSIHLPQHGLQQFKTARDMLLSKMLLRKKKKSKLFCSLNWQHTLSS